MVKHTASFEFNASVETLRSVHTSGDIPGDLLAPVKAMLTEMTTETHENRQIFYIMSSDGNKEIRDLTAYLLVKACTGIFPKTYLIDCDFCETGMSGLVPANDSAGFLDMLLYGTSFKTASQKTGGVNIIGAGSFPVTKRMPFSQEAFTSVARYIRNQSQCAVMTGPALDDDGKLHPLAEILQNIIFVDTSRSGSGGMEEKLANMESSKLLLIKVLSAKTPPSAAERISAPTEITQKPPPAIDPGIEADETESLVLENDVPSGETAGGGAEDQGSSFLPKIITGVLALLLIAFLFYWLSITKPLRGPEETLPKKGESHESSTDESTATRQPRSSAAESSLAGPTSAAVDSSRPLSVIHASNEADLERGTDSKNTIAIDSEARPAVVETGILSDKESLLRELSGFKGKYLIHISSFRAIDRAKSETDYLLKNEFEAFIAKVDLGAKGIWFRVYCGPMDTRERARELKLELDELARVKFTRITKVK